MNTARHLLILTVHYSGLEDGGVLQRFMETFETVITEEVEGGKSVGCYLTGGADSRAILAVLLDNGIDVTAVTYPRGDDEEIAHTYGLDHVTSSIGSA